MIKQKGSNKAFIKGTLVLMIFGLLSKIIGAIYRIPLTKIITAEGMGIYQMVFPLYTLMLTLSSSGLPSSISKIISECYAKNQYKQAERVLKVSFLLLFLFSILCTLVVIICSRFIAEIQGNSDAYLSYLGLAPAILFVGLISGFRGYFQGRGIMTPSAVSGFIEQIVKLVCGLYFAHLFSYREVAFAVFGAVLGISLSEFVAFIYLLLRYILTKRKSIKMDLDNTVFGYKQTAKKILSYSILVTLGGLIMPLTMLIDSVIVINILKKLGMSISMATSLFGLQTGTVGSIINMPVILSLSISTAILPFVSSKKTQNDNEGVIKYSSKAILLGIIIALPASFGCMTFSKQIIELLYSNMLSQSEVLISANILEVASIGIFYLALVQISSGILQGISKFYIPLISLSVGAVIKIILNLILVSIPEINIIGAEISTVSCYAVAFIINMIFLIKYKVLKLDYRIFAVFILSLIIYLSKFAFNLLIKNNLNFHFSLFMIIILVIIIYLILVSLLYKNTLKNEKLTKKKGSL